MLLFIPSGPGGTNTTTLCSNADTWLDGAALNIDGDLWQFTFGGTNGEG